MVGKTEQTISFFRPTFKKLIVPSLFFFFPVINYLAFPIPYIGIYLMFFTLSLCIPFYSLLAKLGLLIWNIGLIGRQQVPTFFGLMLVMFIYTFIFYILICFTVYIKERYPNTIWTKKW